MTAEVLVYHGASPGLLSAIGRHFPVLGPVADPASDLSEAERLSVRAYVGQSRVGSSIVEALPNLELIACIGTGYDGIDLDLLRRRGIRITNNPSSNAGSVAEMALALLLALVRNIVSGDAHVRAGKWPETHPRARMPNTRGLIGRRIGILGLGSIGGEIAKRLAHFGTELAYHNRSRRPGIDFPYFDSPAALAEWAEVLVVSARADAGNRHLVDGAVLAALGPQGILVNIARGSLVDEPALIAALQDGGIAGAALDVFADEPNVPDALRALPNVVLTPHEGGVTQEATAAGRATLVANLEAFFAGKPLLTEVRL